MSGGSPLRSAAIASCARRGWRKAMLSSRVDIRLPRTLDHLFHQRDYIVRPNCAWFQNLRVESAESPARAGWIACLDLGIVNGALDARTVDVQRRAGAAQVGDFKARLTGPEALAGTHQAPIQPGCGKVLAERAGK